MPASINSATPILMNSTNTMPAWPPPTRSQPHMTTPGKITTSLATLAITALGLTGCSSDDDTQETGQDHPVENLLATDARADQQAAGAATQMAMQLGFDQVQPVAEHEIETVRENAEERSNTAEELDVEPAECAGPIAELDWSPIMATSDAVTRVDFGRENFMGAGSVEVAGITEDTGGSAQAADEVAAHQNPVDETGTNCNDLTKLRADEHQPHWAE